METPTHSRSSNTFENIDLTDLTHPPSTAGRSASTFDLEAQKSSSRDEDVQSRLQNILQSMNACAKRPAREKSTRFRSSGFVRFMRRLVWDWRFWILCAVLALVMIVVIVVIVFAVMYRGYQA